MIVKHGKNHCIFSFKKDLVLKNSLSFMYIEENGPGDIIM